MNPWIDILLWRLNSWGISILDHPSWFYLQHPFVSQFIYLYFCILAPKVRIQFLRYICFKHNGLELSFLECKTIGHKISIEDEKPIWWKLSIVFLVHVRNVRGKSTLYFKLKGSAVKIIWIRILKKDFWLDGINRLSVASLTLISFNRQFWTYLLGGRNTFVNLWAWADLSPFSLICL